MLGFKNIEFQDYRYIIWSEKFKGIRLSPDVNDIKSVTQQRGETGPIAGFQVGFWRRESTQEYGIYVGEKKLQTDH